MRPQHHDSAFDTLSAAHRRRYKSIADRAVSMGANLRIAFEEYLCMSLDETTTRADVELLWKIFAKTARPCPRSPRLKKASSH
jgi:glycine dehydrogenase